MVPEFRCLLQYSVNIWVFIILIFFHCCSIRLKPIFIIINNARMNKFLFTSVNLFLINLINFNKCLRTNLLDTSRKEPSHLEYETGGFHPICGFCACNLTWNILKIQCHLAKNHLFLNSER